MDVINNRMLSLFNCVLILFEEQKITCIYFCQSSRLMKTLCIAILDTFVELHPPQLFGPSPNNLFDSEEHKVVIQLGPIKNQKLSLGKYTKCPSIHFKTYFKNLAYV